jgi:NTP pyrophosphatase (non-canonical NTP hydrolase)
MKDWDVLIQELVKFREERNWAQFHNPKDLALALSIEASELNELFLWKKAEDADQSKIREELADVLSYALLLAHHYQLDIGEVLLEKIKLNDKKYPVDKAKGNAKKYTEL